MAPLEFYPLTPHTAKVGEHNHIPNIKRFLVNPLGATITATVELESGITLLGHPENPQQNDLDFDVPNDFTGGAILLRARRGAQEITERLEIPGI